MTILTGNTTTAQTAAVDFMFLSITSTASLIVSSGEAIDWGNNTVNKKLIINGTVIAEAGDGIDTGSTAGVSTATTIFIGQTGTVIGSSNAYHTVGDLEKVINHGSMLSTSGSTVFIEGDSFELLNNGSISSKNFAGINLSGDGANIISNGDITSLANFGISVLGNDAVIVNSGNILGSLGGIGVSGLAANITNNGNITGGIVFNGGDATEHTLVNHGVITGDVSSEDNNATKVTNTGKIFGDLVGDDANDTFVNRGYVSGAIATGSGQDRLVLTGGTFDGVAQGGGDDDLYFIDRTDLNLFEKNDGGTDEVFATASFRLDSAFENLTIAGKDNFYAIGNELANELTGNRGNNLIKGLAGADTLKGDAGDDILIGGNRNDRTLDTFLFSSGDDSDTIRNFQTKGRGHDVIDLDSVFTISDFNDLKNNHMSQRGNNVVIDALGGDFIVLEGVKLNTLVAGDFQF